MDRLGSVSTHLVCVNLESTRKLGLNEVKVSVAVLFERELLAFVSGKEGDQ